jgi:site-specific recombinase XerD
MNNEIIKNNQNNSLTEIQLINKAKNYSNYSYAKNTFKNYHSDFKKFKAWCQDKNFSALPADANTITLYITHLAEQNYKTSSIERKIFAIAKFHEMDNQLLNLKDKTFIAVWNGIKRKLGTAKLGRSPLLINDLRLILSKIEGETNIALRDKVLISFGWASAMRRSEIVALNWSNIEFIDKGALITIRNSKTDQFGKGQKIAILYGKNKLTCPIRNLRAWKNISINNEAVFTSVHRSNNVMDKRLSCIDVARIIKKLLLKANIDPSNYAGHSLRSGFITTAANNKLADHNIMKHSRHKSVQAFLVYKRDNSLIDDNPTSGVGL